MVESFVSSWTIPKRTTSIFDKARAMTTARACSPRSSVSERQIQAGDGALRIIGLEGDGPLLVRFALASSALRTHFVGSAFPLFGYIGHRSEGGSEQGLLGSRKLVSRKISEEPWTLHNADASLFCGCVPLHRLFPYSARPVIPEYSPPNFDRKACQTRRESTAGRRCSGCS